MKSKRRTQIYLAAAGLLLLTSLACIATRPENPARSGRGDASSCNGLNQVDVTLFSFSEDPWEQSDGTPGGINCDYTYQVTNHSDLPLILIYNDHFYYGDNPPPNDYEFGWQKTRPILPGESWQLSSSASSTINQPLYLDLISWMAVVYDTPGCAWLTEDGIQKDILEIADGAFLRIPCKLIDLDNAPEAAPDLNQGLLGN